MKGIGILTAEWLITGLIVYAGLSGKQILFINGARSVAITLGAIGFTMCMIMPTIGKFISNAPAHPLTIMGYLFGAIALFTTVVQIFKWNIPIIHDPKFGVTAKSIHEPVQGKVDSQYLKISHLEVGHDCIQPDKIVTAIVPVNPILLLTRKYIRAILYLC